MREHLSPDAVGEKRRVASPRFDNCMEQMSTHREQVQLPKAVSPCSVDSSLKICFDDLASMSYHIFREPSRGSLDMNITL